LVISSEGSSGYYPGCTDLAYKTAISDGVDVLDCPVQMPKDGIPVCLGSINLLDKTNVAESNFNNLVLQVPELEGVTGIFTFSLTWSEIQSLKRKLNHWFLFFLLRVEILQPINLFAFQIRKLAMLSVCFIMVRNLHEEHYFREQCLYFHYLTRYTLDWLITSLSDRTMSCDACRTLK